MNDSRPQPPKRIPARRRWILALVVVGMIGTAGWIWATGGTRNLAAHRQTLRAQGWPGSLAELNERRKPVPGKPSGVDRLISLARAGAEADPELEKKLFQGPGPLSVPPARRQEIRRVVRESARQPGGLCSESDKDWFALMQSYLRLCQEVHGVAMEAEVRADWQEVVEGMLDLIFIAALLDDEIAAELSGLGWVPEQRAIHSLLPGLAGRPIGETNWARIQEGLSRREGVRSLQLSGLGAHLAALDQIETLPGALWKQWADGGNLPRFGWKRVQVLFQMPAIPGQMLEDELERFAMLARPLPDSLQAVDVVWQRRMSRFRGSALQALGMGWMIHRSEIGYASRLLSVRLGMALCAVERFRLRQSGAIPKDLSEVTTGPDPLLARVPLDPFTGQPLVLERTDGGYVLRRPPIPLPGSAREDEESNRERMELRVRVVR